MIKLNLEKWKDEKYREGTLLFVETFLENVFKYSFDSYKAPALNAHYLCYDILKTILFIKANSAFKGNLLPLYDELNFTLDNDITLQGLSIDRETFYTFKDKNGRFYSLDSFEGFQSKKIKDSISYLNTKYENEWNYVSTIYDMIIQEITSDDYSYKTMSNIVELTRSMVTELIDSGYNKEYLYKVAEKCFINSHDDIIDNIKSIYDFFSTINLRTRNYKVILGISSQSYGVLKNSIKATFRKAKKYEQHLFNVKNGYVCIFENLEELDPYSAQETAMKVLNQIESIYRLSKHEFKYTISDKAIVIDRETRIRNIIQIDLNPMRVDVDNNNESTDEALHAVLSNFNAIPDSFLKMIELHKFALSNHEQGNQLLNLWTIIELFVENDIRDGDKINQICNVLPTILCADYLNKKLSILYNDINLICPEVNDIILRIDIGQDKYEKFLALIALEEYDNLFEEVSIMLIDYPIITYRMLHFHDSVLSNSIEIINYIENHSNRLRWHLMRIYRNRNMVVHDGEYMPYINTIIENLHFYVDIIFDLLIHYYKKGMYVTSDILTHMKNREYRYYKTLGKGVKKILK